jgi:hypothetical protein
VHIQARTEMLPWWLLSQLGRAAGARLVVSSGLTRQSGILEGTRAATGLTRACLRPPLTDDVGRRLGPTRHSIPTLTGRAFLCAGTETRLLSQRLPIASRRWQGRYPQAPRSELPEWRGVFINAEKPWPRARPRLLSLVTDAPRRTSLLAREQVCDAV